MPEARKPQAAVVQFPRPSLRRLDANALIPSARSLLVCFGLLAGAVGAYVAARESSIFAVRSVEVGGLAPGDAAAVRRALAPLRGSSLLTLDPGVLSRRIAAIPGVRSFAYDRAFPHTLRIVARPEEPVAVLRRGAESWLVSADGRVLHRIPRGARARMPRIWVPRAVAVASGETLTETRGGTAARMLALLAAAELPDRPRTIRTNGELTFILRSRLELRLGSPSDARLKLAIARRILTRLGNGYSYLDVSVPSRPVAGRQ